MLRLDESNMEDVYYMPEEYTQEMLYGLETNIKPDRTDLDLLFACLTEWGLLLSKPYSSEKISGYTVHYYDGKELAACFNENISETVIRKIAGQHPRRAVFVTQVFGQCCEDQYERAFSYDLTGDTDKSNMKESWSKVIVGN